MLYILKIIKIIFQKVDFSAKDSYSIFRCATNPTSRYFSGGLMTKKRESKKRVDLPLIIIEDIGEVPTELDFDPKKEIVLEIDF